MTEEKDQQESNSKLAKEELTSGELGKLLEKVGISTEGEAFEILLRVLVSDKANAIAKEPKPPLFSEQAELFSEWVGKFPEEVTKSFVGFSDDHSDFVFQLSSGDGDVVYSMPLAYGNNNSNEFIMQNLGGVILPTVLDLNFRTAALSQPPFVSDENGVPILGQKSEEHQKIIDYATKFFQSGSRESEFAFGFLKEKDPVYWKWIEDNCPIPQEPSNRKD